MSDAESSVVDSERQPLLEPKSQSVWDAQFCGSYSFDAETAKFECSNETEELHKEGITDTMCYNTERLTSWDAFRVTYTTIWFSKELWGMMFRLLIVAISIMLFTLLIAQNPEAMEVSKFTQVSKFLNVVCGLLLGFFMASSMNRWYASVNAFLELFDAIRNLQMQFTALGVGEEQTNLCMRYAFASAWLLFGCLLLETKRGSQDDRDKMWLAISQKTAPLGRGCEKSSMPLLTDSEITFLRTMRDPPGIMFMWIAALIGNLAQEGWIPAMPTPTYGRIMNLCQDGHAGIRGVRESISVQAPLNYTHMLATLVHLNNLLNAITLGIVAGLSIGTVLVAHGVHIYPAQRSHDTMLRNSEKDLQNLVVTIFYCTLGPILYQAMLVIAMQIAQPFKSEDDRAPLHRLLHQLEVDMVSGRTANMNVPFVRPDFTNPPAKN
jgi:predicted membrane chloride channel (bestrophin family)